MVPVSQLLEGHKELAAKLARFEFGAAAHLIAGLAIFPQLHANTIRLEILAHLTPWLRGRLLRT